MRALAGRPLVGIALQVITAMRMDGLELVGCVSRNPIATGALSSTQLRERTVNPDEEHHIRLEQPEAVAKAPRLTEDVIHDDVVSGLCHSGDCAMETSACPGKDSLHVGRRKLRRPGYRAHGAKRINRHVKERRRQNRKKLGCDARLARARNPVEENDPAHSTSIGHAASVPSAPPSGAHLGERAGTKPEPVAVTVGMRRAG